MKLAVEMVNSSLVISLKPDEKISKGRKYYSLISKLVKYFLNIHLEILVTVSKSLKGINTLEFKRKIMFLQIVNWIRWSSNSSEILCHMRTILICEIISMKLYIEHFVHSPSQINSLINSIDSHFMNPLSIMFPRCGRAISHIKISSR